MSKKNVSGSWIFQNQNAGRLKMLVLSRKNGQSIEIDGVGTVRVLKCSRGLVKLGIDIAPGIGVRRSELAQKVVSESGSDEEGKHGENSNSAACGGSPGGGGSGGEQAAG
jgi:carbon storage regulator CsrA